VSATLQTALGPALKILEEAKLRQAFEHFDNSATTKANWYRWLAVSAALCGAAAVVLAVLQLAALLFVDRPRAVEPGRIELWSIRFLGKPGALEALTVTEFIFIVVAIVAIAAGILAKTQRGWLRDRHKAEWLRSLHFRFLVDPDLWSGLHGAREEARNRLHARMEQVIGLGSPGLEAWAGDDEPPEAPTVSPGGRWDKRALAELVDYYLVARLRHQVDYLALQAARRDWWERLLRPIPLGTFFLAAAAALTHFVLVFGRLSRHELGATSHQVAVADVASILLVLVAGALPAVGAGVRTCHLAQEFGRNSLRFKAKRSALEKIGSRLKLADSPEQIFHWLWACEYVLESDYREWLRLMIDAEWIG